MKTLPLLLVAIFSLSLLPSRLIAQDSEKEKEVKIKIVKEKDGERTVVDTTYWISVDDVAVDMEEIEKILEEAGLDDLDMDFEFDGDEDMKVKVIRVGDDAEDDVVIVKRLDEDADLFETEMEYEISVMDSDSGTHKKRMKVSVDGGNVFISEDGEVHEFNAEDGKHRVIMYKSDDSDDEDIFVGHEGVVWVGDDSRQIEVIEGEDGTKVMVKNEDGTTREYKLEDGKGTYFIGEDGELVKTDNKVQWVDETDKMKRITVHVEDEGETIVISENGETIELNDLDKGSNAFFFSSDSGEGEHEVFVEVIEKKDGENTVTIKNKIILKSLSEEDFKTLEKSGMTWDSDDTEKLEIDKLAFHPNPNDGKFSLEFTTPEHGTTELAIFDIHGKQVYNERITNFKGHYKKEIDISSEEKGTYFLRINQGKKVSTRKIILE